ncbi:ATP-binding protein [Streptomyces sp. NBC_01210]|uniref:ATP-binding protein n=1 Tax=Streptomyces sp. NBC_01210 TaxID=2903774 RepID=UPI002E113CDE|nr:ATP-binding protein [Streptomyces sp. NBC_01210]
MSLPLTRRIARVALLIAAGAAPVVGAVGSASAADLPQAPVGLTAFDADGVSSTVDGAALKTSDLAGNTGGDAVEQTVPAAGKAVDKAGKAAAPVAQKAAGDAAGSAGDAVGKAAGTATGRLAGSSLQTDSLGGGLPTQQLPVESLPLG